LGGLFSGKLEGLFLCLRGGRMAGTLVCETVTGRTMEELIAARDAVVGADMVELRLDGVAGADAAGALSGRDRPVIVTCRPAWEGGRFDGSEEARLALLSQAAELGAEFVDVEWQADRARLSVGERTRLILSHHVFEGVPADLADRIAAMRAAHPAIVKVAIQTSCLRDCGVLAAASRGGSEQVIIGMGSAGVVTRVHPARFGSSWTYSGTAAPGQIASRDLIESYRVRSTTPDTPLYGVVGAPLQHSASPAMHNAAFAALGIDAIYAPLETADADDVVEFARAFGIRGASVTAPLKRAFDRHATPADDEVAAIGSLNTLRWRAGRLEARNFDVAGFLDPLAARGIRLSGARAVVLGAGGAARAAAFALRGQGARVEMSARRRDRAVGLARDLGVAAAGWPPEGGWDVLVNATPAGTWPETGESPVDPERLAGGFVYDLVYNPSPTRLVTDATALGIPAIGGLEMLVAQAARQFEWWTGMAPDRGVMTHAAVDFVTRQQVADR
jgi:3-dehydroquinate dehydratase/shikimate dehydrogenase